MYFPVTPLFFVKIISSWFEVWAFAGFFKIRVFFAFVTAFYVAKHWNEMGRELFTIQKQTAILEQSVRR